MAAIRTFLAPGQRYVQPGGGRQADRQFTISCLGRDGLGLPRVTVLSPDGRWIVVYAAQVEAAVAGGQLLPVVGAGRSPVASC